MTTTDIIATMEAAAEYIPAGYRDGSARRDCILVPSPIACGAVQEDGDPAPCWGDYDQADIRAAHARILARLAPGRRIVEGDDSTEGEYLILADVEG
jgi:hypothetical protein